MWAAMALTDAEWALLGKRAATTAVLEVTDAADGDDLLVCSDRLVPTLSHAPPPLEQ
jgi:hypothetical protein